MVSELDLDRAFANKLATSRSFCAWILRQTKFADCAGDAVLLDKQQAEAKPRKKPENWWRHWWCELDGAGSETDIFAVFGFSGSARRIALHIEDKPPHGRFTKDQPKNYRRRGDFMRGKAQYMDYSDFETILLAPDAFLADHRDVISHFDRCITYESVAAEIPIFGASLANARAKKGR
jgi:hypothetical protein